MTISTSVLNEIHRLRNSGQQIGLFIGRRPYETVPREEGTVWVSLDKGVNRIHPESSDEVLRDLYLEANCMDIETIRTLYALFDKVVVDRATYKSFSSDLLPWKPPFKQIAARLMGLLRPGGTLICDFFIPTGRLPLPRPGSIEEKALLKKIAESQAMRLYEIYLHNGRTMSENVSKKETTKETDRLQIVEELLADEHKRKIERNRSKGIALISPHWDVVDYCLERDCKERERYLEIKGYLRNFFQFVEYYQDVPYPYKNRSEPDRDDPETLSRYQEINRFTPYLVATNFRPPENLKAAGLIKPKVSKDPFT